MGTSDPTKIRKLLGFALETETIHGKKAQKFLNILDVMSLLQSSEMSYIINNERIDKRKGKCD